MSEVDTRLNDFGGFPTPIKLVKSLFNKFFPQASKSINKQFTMPRTSTISGRGTIAPDSGKEVPYISFEAVVGRNSRFHDLTEEQMDELGGVEYRALRVLLWIVILVCRYLD
jgi:hypothetical protein